MDKSRIVALTIFCSLISVTTWATSPLAKYRIIEIPVNGYAAAAGMNNRGDVVGGSLSQAFLYDHRSGAVNYLTFDSATFTTATGISDDGLIAGWAHLPQPPVPVQVPVLWSTIGGAEALPPGDFFAASANAVNNSGLVVGAFGGPSGMGALTWSGLQHTLTTLADLSCFECFPPSGSEAVAVNARGHIVGWSVTGSAPGSPNPSFGTHAVEWHDGRITDLQELAGLNGTTYNTFANGINNRDDVVGELDGPTGARAFLYHRGNMADLGTLPGDIDSSAESINDRGEIVGWSEGITAMRAVIYMNGRMCDLNTLIDPTSPLAAFVHLDEAVAINSRGWIAANGTDSRGDQHAYLLIRGDMRDVR